MTGTPCAEGESVTTRDGNRTKERETVTREAGTTKGGGSPNAGRSSAMATASRE